MGKLPCSFNQTHYPSYERSPHIFRMVNINATTPQLKAAKAVLEAYSSLNLKSSELIFAKNFRYQTFPKTTDHHEETKEEHFQKYKGVLAPYAKMDVCI